MQKKILLVVYGVFFSLGLFSQNFEILDSNKAYKVSPFYKNFNKTGIKKATYLQRDFVNNWLDTIYIIFYDIEGQKNKEIFFRDGKKSSKVEYSYTHEGVIIESNSINLKNKHNLTKCLYHYDSLNNIQKKENIISYKKDTVYNIQEFIYKNNQLELTKYSYNKFLKNVTAYYFTKNLIDSIIEINLDTFGMSNLKTNKLVHVGNVDTTIFYYKTGILNTFQYDDRNLVLYESLQRRGKDTIFLQKKGLKYDSLNRIIADSTLTWANKANGKGYNSHKYSYDINNNILTMVSTLGNEYQNVDFEYANNKIKSIKITSTLVHSSAFNFELPYYNKILPKKNSTYIFKELRNYDKEGNITSLKRYLYDELFSELQFSIAYY